MRIYSMTATFGKLSHQTLQLEPGLNIIEAPNEWGKSTWCAFLAAMLYGIDTKQRSTDTFLADKERFAPWSGEPMSGRIELNWNGRDITIERSTKGRTPFGEFRAYETATGLDVPELTAANCGLQLLGVERNVFTQAGFIRLQDMPVTQNESLRRRLNNLVTTGNENSAGDDLGQQLKELKNKVRHNKTGILPQAEYERDQLREQLHQHAELNLKTRQIRRRQEELEQQHKLLENHAAALRFEAAKNGAEKIKTTRESCARLETELKELEESCRDLPDTREISEKVQAGHQLLQQQKELLLSAQQLPTPPAQPEVPALYRGQSPEQAVAAAQAGFSEYKALETQAAKQAKLPLIGGILAALLIPILICGLSLNTLILWIGAPITVLLAAILIAVGVGRSAAAKAQMNALSKQRPGIAPENWVSDAQNYGKTQEQYLLLLNRHQQVCGDHTRQQTALDGRIQAYAGEDTLEKKIAAWESMQQKHTDLSVKRRELQNVREHAAALASVATTAPAPEFPDEMTLSASETEQALQSCRMEQNDLRIQLGQCLGQIEAIGQEEMLRARLDSVCRRIVRLENHYRALELAQDVLYQATTALQRRFAPRISKRAQALFSRLTDGRYQRITLSDDLRLQASAENEDNLRSSLWRSDGTVDQLYLSLRLAVASEVTPDAPLVLDDALARFDDTRAKIALEVLQEEAREKQVILFSCQTREKSMLQ